MVRAAPQAHRSRRRSGDRNGDARRRERVSRQCMFWLRWRQDTLRQLGVHVSKRGEVAVRDLLAIPAFVRLGVREHEIVRLPRVDMPRPGIVVARPSRRRWAASQRTVGARRAHVGARVHDERASGGDVAARAREMERRVAALRVAVVQS